MTSSRPPGVSRDARSSTSSTTPTGRPFSSATRSRSAGSNSISPRMARSVMRGDMRLQAGEIRQFVDAFLPDHGGIHVGQQKLLAPDAPGLHHDVDGQIAARLAQAGRRWRRCRRGCRRKGMSAATSLNSHCACPGERQERRARRPPPCYRARGWRDCRSAWRRETSEWLHTWKTTRRCLSQGRPPAASRRSRSSWRKEPAASSSMPIPCRSIATCACSRRGRRWTRRRGRRTGSMAMSMPR